MRAPTSKDLLILPEAEFEAQPRGRESVIKRDARQGARSSGSVENHPTISFLASFHKILQLDPSVIDFGRTDIVCSCLTAHNKIFSSFQEKQEIVTKDQ